MKRRDENHILGLASMIVDRYDRIDTLPIATQLWTKTNDTLFGSKYTYLQGDSRLSDEIGLHEPACQRPRHPLPLLHAGAPRRSPA